MKFMVLNQYNRSIRDQKKAKVYETIYTEDKILEWNYHA